MPEFTFATGTGEIYYEVIESQAPDSGQAPVLTLLHNFMSSGRAAWGPLLEELSQHYRLLLPDLPGHGRSIGHPARYDHRAMARQLAALMRHEGAQRGHLAGCSSGGMLALLLTHDQLVQPATLTLVSTTHSVNPATTGNHAALVPEEFQAARRWMEATARLHDPFRYDGYYEEELLPGFRNLNGATAIDLPLQSLRALAMPVCIIHGEKDEFFPPYIPRQMAETVQNGEVHIIPNQSHALLFRRPWQVSKIMVQFLANHPMPVQSSA